MLQGPRVGNRRAGSPPVTKVRRRRRLGRGGKSITSGRNCTCRGPVARGDKEDHNKVIVARVGQVRSTLEKEAGSHLMRTSGR